MRSFLCEILKRLAPRLHRVLYASALSLMLAASALAGDVEAALLDRQQFPPSDWWRYYYLSTEHATSDLERTHQAVALRLIVPSVSRQPILERCLPIEVTPTLYRIDLADLGWSHRDWLGLLARYPYSHYKNPITLRADWLLLAITDSQESDAYYRLLFGRVPKTRDEALAILGVNGEPGLRFGLIEGESGVSKAGTRWIENRPALRGYAWGTRDSLKLDAKSDPLENPTGAFVHQGEEWIFGLTKLHLATGTRGALQAYLLANGQGVRVDRAPVDLVEDSLRFRGYAEIRNPGSCIGCHDGGLNYPTRNLLRDNRTAGVEAYADYRRQQQIEAFHFADVTKELRRNNEDFAAIVRLATGCEPAEATAAYQSSIGVYDAPVDLERAAAELYATPDELKLALALGSAGGVKLGARVSGLAHGQTIPRAAWEESYLAAAQVLRVWRLKHETAR